MELTWGNLLTLAATTGVITALLNQGLGWLRDWRASSEKRKANAGYLALRVAVMLEAYADACSDVASAIDTHMSSGGHAGEQTTTLPQAPVYPADDESWRVIAPDLLERCLSFPNKVVASQKVVQSVTIWGDYEDMVQQCMEQCVDRGLEAWGLATDLRTRYRFEAHSYVYDYPGHLRDLRERLDKHRRQQEESDAQNWIDMGSSEKEPAAE
jgi:hypothetical protein